MLNKFLSRFRNILSKKIENLSEFNTLTAQVKEKKQISEIF